MKFIIVAFVNLVFVMDLFGQVVSISSPNQRIVYQWLENPLEIVIENHSCKEIVVKADHGEISGRDCNFIYTIKDIEIENVRISAGLKSKGKIEWIEEIEFNVKPIPTPKVQVGLSSDDKINKQLLINSPFLLILSSPFGFELIENPKKERVVEYSIQILRNDSIVFESLNNLGREFSDETKQFINEKCLNNDILIVSNVSILLYDSEKRKLEDNLKVKILAED